MKVWLVIEENWVEHDSYVISVWGNSEAAQRERDHLESQLNIGVSYWVNEWEVKN